MKKQAAPIEANIDTEIALAETIKRRKFNPYRTVMGKMPTQKDLSGWSHDKWMDLLRFTLIFLEKNEETKEEVYKITDEKRKTCDEYLSIPDHPFQEFIYRIDLWLDDSTNRQYFYKLTTLTRVCFTYLKKHPSLVNSNMKVIIDIYPQRLGWVLAQYKTMDTAAGEIIQRDTMVPDGNSVAPVALPSLQVKLMNSLVKMADFYENVASGLSDKDVKKMTVIERVKVLKDLNFIFATSTKKQQTNHLTQININTKDVKGAEEAMLDYIKKTQEK